MSMMLYSHLSILYIYIYTYIYVYIYIYQETMCVFIHIYIWRCAINVLQRSNRGGGPDIRPNVAKGKGPPGRAKGRQGGQRAAKVGQEVVK